MKSTLKRTWTEIDMDAIEYNYKTIRKAVGEHVKFLGVLKADAYGHSAYQIGKKLEELGADYLGVSNIDEAVELRSLGISAPILVFGNTPSDQVGKLISNNLTQTVTDKGVAISYNAEAQKLGKKLKIHIKVDTGMSRLGFLCDGDMFDKGIEDIIYSCNLENFLVEGIYTHLSMAYGEDEVSSDFTAHQFKLFNDLVNEVEEKLGRRFEIKHCASTGAVANYPETYLDMVRPGSLLYGWGGCAQKLGLKPVMSFKTIVSAIKTIPKGTKVGYSGTYITDKTTRIGILPIGYGDGYRIALSGKWKPYTVDGHVQQIGRIAMDMCMVDLSDCENVDVGSEVEIFGKNNSLLDMSALIGSIGYEITGLISKRVPRKYISHGKIIAEELYLRDKE